MRRDTPGQPRMNSIFGITTRDGGTPVHDEKKHVEFLMLESAQAGLSWSTLLMKRENDWKAYDPFDPVKGLKYNERKIGELLSDPRIVRNRRKIEVSINHAKCFLAVQKKFGRFDRHIWGFVNHGPVNNRLRTISHTPARTPLSDQSNKDFIQRGFRFVGSTLIYAHLQATGMVNDHLITCFRYEEPCSPCLQALGSTKEED